MFRAYCSSFVTGYLPAVTIPCPSAPTPHTRRIVVCSGNDIPMITELGEPANDGFTSPNHTQTHIGLLIIISPLLVLRERFNCLWVFHVTSKKQKIMRCLEFIIFSVMNWNGLSVEIVVVKHWERSGAMHAQLPSVLVSLTRIPLSCFVLLC